MAGVRTYNSSVRVGNWTEDLVLEEDQIKDFLDKKENNQLLIQRASNLLRTLLKPEELSKSSDGYIHIGDKVCLMHIPTQSVISGHMSAYKSQEARQLVSPADVTSSFLHIHPCARNVFVIGSYGNTAKVGDPVKFDELITFTTLPGPGGQLSLESDKATIMEHAKYSREQELKLKDKITYNAAWRILCFNQEERLESTGMPVPTNQKVFINHSNTNNHLAVHAEWKPRTSFGREYEATGGTKFTIPFRTEDTQNYFMVVTGTYLEELIAKKEQYQEALH